MNRTNKLSLALAVALVLPTAVQADTQLTLSGDPTCHADFQRIAISGSRVRLDGGESQRPLALIYDNAEKLAQTLDISARTYSEFDIDEDTLDYLGDVQSSGKARLRNMGVDADHPQASADACVKAMATRVAAGASPGSCGGGRRGSGAYGAGLSARGGRGIPGTVGASGAPQSMTAEQRKAMYESAMAQMSGKQREAYENVVRQSEQALAQSDARAATSERTTEQQKRIGGVACEVRQRRVHDQLVAEDCIADPKDFALQPADLARLKSIVAVYGKFMATVTSGMGGLGMQKTGGIQDLDRFPIERVCYANGSSSGRVTLSISHDSLPGSLFEISADYRPADSSAGNGHAAEP
jgi:hypothetical protein